MDNFKAEALKPSEMIARAIAQFLGKDSDPMQVGRDAGVRDALWIYAGTIVEVMRDMKASIAQ